MTRRQTEGKTGKGRWTVCRTGANAETETTDTTDANVGVCDDGEEARGADDWAAGGAGAGDIGS